MKNLTLFVKDWFLINSKPFGIFCFAYFLAFWIPIYAMRTYYSVGCTFIESYCMYGWTGADYLDKKYGKVAPPAPKMTITAKEAEKLLKSNEEVEIGIEK